MDAITEDVEHYIYKISYWMTNLSVAIGALLGGLMYGYSMLLLFLNSSLYIFNCTLYFIYLVTSRPKSSKSKVMTRGMQVVIKITNNEYISQL